jgi:hypothetical protein
MRGWVREVLLLVVCSLTLLGPSVYLYARNGGAVRAAAPLAPPAAVSSPHLTNPSSWQSVLLDSAAAARLASPEAAAQSASTALAGLFAEEWCWVG